MRYTLKFYHCSLNTFAHNGYFIESTTNCAEHSYLRTDRSIYLDQVISSFIKSKYLTFHMSETCLNLHISKSDDYVETICKFDNLEQLTANYPELFI